MHITAAHLMPIATLAVWKIEGQCAYLADDASFLIAAEFGALEQVDEGRNMPIAKNFSIGFLNSAISKKSRTAWLSPARAKSDWR
jgi:hypothetical protein